MSDVGAVALDAYRACVDGVYRTPRMIVRARHRRGLRRAEVAATSTFDVGREGASLVIEHGLSAETISDDLAGLLSEELFDPGWVRGADLFEEMFVGIVLTCAPRPRDAWTHFYRNTLDRLDGEVARPTGMGSIAAYAPVHAHAAALVQGRSVLELGSCFGFQALRLARAGLHVTASDISPGAVALLRDMSARLGIPLATFVADAIHVDAPDRCADTVLALHLLEHVESEDACAIVREAYRLARRRVVVAVPFEADPAEQFGHLRSLSLSDLEQWGRAVDGPAHVYEHHGGWLVLDRPSSA